MKLMKIMASLVAAAICLATSLSAQTPTLVVHRNANLRQDASTSSAVIGNLVPGDEVTAISAAKKSGFYHVRTADGREGWVYQTLVHVEEADTEEADPPAAAISPALDASWEKPAPKGSLLQGPAGSDPCPADGEAGGDLGTNRLKNRADAPAAYHPISFEALQSLAYPDAPTNRKKWSAGQLDQIKPYEGAGVSVIGFLVAVKKQFGGGGEATNCHFSQEAFVDSHLALVAKRGQGEEKAIVVEPTPRFYAKHPTWVYSTLKKLDDSPDPVRISGWVLMDPVHKGHLGKYRATLWEIHPITKIEVFRNGKWIEW